MNAKQISIGGAIVAIGLVVIAIGTMKFMSDSQAEGFSTHARALSGMDSDLGVQQYLEQQQSNPNWEGMLEDVLRDTRELMQYPANSFPLHAGARDLIDHHVVKIPPRALVDLETGKSVSDVQCALQPDSNRIHAGAKFRARLHCSHGKGQEPLQLVVDEVVMSRIQIMKTGALKKIRLQTPDVTAQPDKKSFLFEYTPTSRDWGGLHLTVKFTVDFAGEKVSGALTANGFSSPVAPAEFVRVVGDSVVDGSLQIDVLVRTDIPGRYTIEGNLFQASSDLPVAFASTRPRLEKGTSIVQLTFFGRIFHKKSADGPYVLRGLRGRQHTDLDPDLLHKSQEEVAKILRQDRTPTPGRREMRTYKSEYRTARYNTNDFSFKEFDSPDKRRRLKALEMLAASAR